MANEVTGKMLQLYIGGVEQPIKSITFDRNFTMLDSTTSATTSPGMESVAGRAKTTTKIDTDLLTPLGTELTSGTCVAETKYIVTAGAIDGIPAGDIFTSDGTETPTADNKCKALGSKITGADLSVSIGGSTFACTSADYVAKYTEFDSTTSATSAPNSEITTGRVKYTSKFDAIMYRTTADKITNSAPTALAVVITFKTGVTVTGNAILHQMSITDEVNGLCKVTYNAEWQGLPTEVGIGYLTMASSQTAQIIYDTGKSVSGYIILSGKTVQSEVNGEAKISYDGTWIGAITPTTGS